LSLHKTDFISTLMSDEDNDTLQGGLTDEEKRENVIRLAFGGSIERYDEFCRAIKQEIPEETAVVLRGSAITGRRWKDGAPFDADGPGRATSTSRSWASARSRCSNRRVLRARRALAPRVRRRSQYCAFADSAA
jgi:hypothetical protein